jgi:16S rRNA processing protein RimM
MTVQGGVKAGKISKPYGLQGEVHIILIPVIVQKLKSGIPLFIDIDGQRVPFFIESVDLVSDQQAIVKVEFINSLEEARKYSGHAVYLDGKDAGESREQVSEADEMVGYRVIDVNLGEIGTLTDIIPSEMNPVWVIEHAGKEIMIPATEDFIQKIDHKNSTLHLDLPEGITQL